MFTSYTGQTWSDFVAASPKAADLQVMSSRLTGAVGVAISIVGIFVALTAYHRSEKWSWYAFLAPGFIVWGSNLAYNVATASGMNTVLMIIGIALLVIGLLVPARTVFGGKGKTK